MYCCIFNMRSFLDVTCYHYTNSPSPTAKIATSLAILFQILYQCMIASLPQKLRRLTCVTPHLIYHQNISIVNFISNIIFSFVKNLEKLTQNIYEYKIASVSISYLLIYISFHMKELDLKTLLRARNQFESFIMKIWKLCNPCLQYSTPFRFFRIQ